MHSEKVGARYEALIPYAGIFHRRPYGSVHSDVVMEWLREMALA